MIRLEITSLTLKSKSNFNFNIFLALNSMSLLNIPFVFGSYHPVITKTAKKSSNKLFQPTATALSIYNFFSGVSLKRILQYFFLNVFSLKNMTFF